MDASRIVSGESGFLRRLLMYLTLRNAGGVRSKR